MHINNQESWIDSAVDRLRDGKLLLLCGAGISFDSGIPVVKSFLETMLRALRFNETHTHKVLSLVPARIPFERFIETITSNCPNHDFLNIFQLGQPNSNHHALAKLAAAGKLRTIVTTNFDQLIERAFEEDPHTLKRGTDFVVYDNPNDFKDIAHDDGRIQLIKIHGSAERPNKMAVTLSRILKDDSRQMVTMMTQRLVSEWPIGSLLVTGYSCSDKFDISPGIASSNPENLTILQLEHLARPYGGANPGDIHPVAIPPWGGQKHDYPFSNFKGYRLFEDTSRVLRQISERVTDSDIPTPNQGIKTRWKAVINKWANDLRKTYPHIACSFVSGAIFQLVESWDEAHQCYQRALHAATRGQQLAWMTACQNAMGNIHLSQGNLSEASDLFEGSLKICTESKNHFGVQQCLLNLSNLYRTRGDLLHSRAIAMNSKALEVIEEHSTASWPLGTRATHHGAMATLYGRQWDFVEAINNFKAARREFKEAGELQRELSVVSNWASALFATLHFDKALEMYEEAIALAHDCGDFLTKGHMMINRGNALARMGHLQKSLDVYLEAEEAITPFVGAEHELISQIRNSRRQVLAMQKSESRRLSPSPLSPSPLTDS